MTFSLDGFPALDYIVFINRGSQPMTIYRERANGRWEYWTYADGQRLYLSLAFVRRERGARIVNV